MYCLKLRLAQGSLLLQILVVLHPSISLANENTQEYLQPFVGLKGGYQWSVDETYHDNGDPEGFIGGIFGGLYFSQDWSWDLGYQYHEELQADLTSVEINTWLLESALRYDWVIDDALSIYGRLGVAYWDMQKTSPYDELNATGFSPVGEMGVGYNIKPNVRLSAGYQYIHNIGDTKTDEYGSHALMLGVSYVFSTAQPQAVSVMNEKTVVVVDTIEPVIPQITESFPQTYTFSDYSLGEEYAFKSDSSYVGQAFASALKDVALVLTRYPQAKVEIVGHTDSTGSYKYNQVLSERRARKVADVLISAGISPAQIHFSGQGEYSPVASNKTAQGRAMNRRVELLIPSFEYQKEDMR